MTRQFAPLHFFVSQLTTQNASHDFIWSYRTDIMINDKKSITANFISVFHYSDTHTHTYTTHLTETQLQQNEWSHQKTTSVNNQPAQIINYTSYKVLTLPAVITSIADNKPLISDERAWWVFAHFSDTTFSLAASDYSKQDSTIHNSAA